MTNLELTKTFIDIAEFLARNDSDGIDVDIKCPMGTLKWHFSFEIEMLEDRNDD